MNELEYIYYPLFAVCYPKPYRIKKAYYGDMNMSSAEWEDMATHYFCSSILYRMIHKKTQINEYLVAHQWVPDKINGEEDIIWKMEVFSENDIAHCLGYFSISRKIFDMEPDTHVHVLQFENRAHTTGEITKIIKKWSKNVK